MNNIVTTVQQLSALQTTTYIYAVLVLVVAFAVAFGIANAIAWQGGNDRSYIKRRITTTIIGLLASLGYWLYCIAVVADNVRNQGFRAQYENTAALALGLIVVGYVGLCFLVAVVARKSKFGSILGAEKEH